MIPPSQTKQIISNVLIFIQQQMFLQKYSKLHFSSQRPMSFCYKNFTVIVKKMRKVMCKRNRNFFNLTYLLQFSIRQQFSTFHALISLNEDIGKNLGKGKLVVIFSLICRKLLILLNMISCQQCLNIITSVVWQMNGRNPTSSTENNVKGLEPRESRKHLRHVIQQTRVRGYFSGFQDL